ncbi:MAG: DUF2330 domain-containing protein [Myxococcota bacterium]
MKFYAFVGLFLVSLATAGLILTPTARACGLFACSAATQTPIVQSGERVVFIRNKAHTTMHVEVSYLGEPTSFGWILPVPTRPVLEDGTPAPLDQIVRVSSQVVFDRLTEATTPRFGLERRLSDKARDCYDTELNAPPAADGGCNWYPGQFGAACLTDGDCFSGRCVAHSTGKKTCTQSCTSYCPTGYECMPLGGWPDADPRPDAGEPGDPADQGETDAADQGGPDPGDQSAPDAGAEGVGAGATICVPITAKPRARECWEPTGGGGGSGGNPPPRFFPSFSDVTVLATADIGPYDAELIEASDATQLMGWLAFNGYFQDPKARPIIEDYVALGYLFVGIKLQNTKSAGDMLPLALTFGENAPCLPLRLTAAAAIPQMPIDIWVLGDARAIPKNFLHGVINERSVSYPEGDGYPEAVAAAVDSVGGRAWVTEFADLASNHHGVLLPYADQTRAALGATTDLFELITQMKQYKVPMGKDLARIAEDTMPKPAGLRGYPGGICGTNGTTCTGPNATHITTNDEYYDNLEWWAAAEHNGGYILGGNFPKLRQRVLVELVDPLLEIESYLNEEYVLTRLFTRISPEAMLRDPLFAFNPDLPMVPRDRFALGEVVFDGACRESVAVTYPSGAPGPNISCFGGTCASQFTVPADSSANPLEAVQVLDESGGPLNIDPSEAAAFDEFLGSAVPGVPTVGSGVVKNPPTTPGKSTGPTGCSAASSWTAAWLAILGLAALALMRRRRSRAVV